MAVIADPFFGVVLDTDLLILFGVHEHLFAALLVFEAKFVEAAATLAAVRLDGGHRRVVRQGVRRFRFAIVNRAGDDWPVGVAIEKLDDDFLANPRDEYRTPILSSPRLRDTHPAWCVFVRGAVTVPVKLHFDSAKFVGEDFFARFADDDGSLWTLNAGLDRATRRTENAIGGNCGEIADEAFF